MSASSRIRKSETVRKACCQVSKKFALDASEFKPLATGHGSCFASDRITVDGAQVGFMYREKGDDDLDSGWRFMAGDESDDTLPTPSNLDSTM